MRQLRDYQVACNEAVRSAFRRGLKAVLVELATGLGKGCIIALMAKMAKEKKRRVLILVNRDILVEQLLAELRFNGVFASREQGQERATLTADIVVASVQSLNARWLKRWPLDHFGFVITDEVHFSASKTFKVVLDHFRGAYHCGVTATAQRHDRNGLWSGYEEICFRMPLKTTTDKDGKETKGGIDEGWLCPFVFEDLEVPVTLDEKLANHATFKEDEEVFDSSKYLPRIATGFVEAFAGKKSLVFATNCRVSLRLSEMIRAEGVDCKHVDSSYMSASETEDALAWFAESKDGILCNAQLLMYGYNMPDIRCLGLGRPISSTVAYKQALGRVSRVIANVDDYATAEERKTAIAESDKPHAKIVSVFWENGSHDLASPSCLLTDNSEEKKKLDELRKPGQQIDLGKLEDQLKAKRMADVAEEMRKYAEKVANSQQKKVRGAVYVADILRQYNPAHKPASDAFVRYVRKLGAVIPDGQYSAYQMMRVKERIEKARA